MLDTFGEKPAIIGELADQLTAAARAAGVGTSTLQSGLAAIGVQAEQAGLGVSEATAALAALASRGIEGTQAAKQLGTVLTELNNPASRAGKALEDAGLSGKSFAQIVDVLSKDAAKAAPILRRSATVRALRSGCFWLTAAAHSKSLGPLSTARQAPASARHPSLTRHSTARCLGCKRRLRTYAMSSCLRSCSRLPMKPSRWPRRSTRLGILRNLRGSGISFRSLQPTLFAPLAT